jgi:hypothetical protein
MSKHLVLSAWTKTACGLNDLENRTTTDQLAETTCKNCYRFVNASVPAHAWSQCKPQSLKRLYLERAGFEPVRVEKILRVRLWSVLTRSEQRKVIRQMQSNPNLARLLVSPHKPIESGSALDQRNKYPRFNHLHSIRHRFSCKNCGYPV